MMEQSGAGRPGLPVPLTVTQEQVTCCHAPFERVCQAFPVFPWKTETNIYSFSDLWRSRRKAAIDGSGAEGHGDDAHL
ncbi:MAG: hypothetical protein R2911_38625 [Caldilineaceae bacterium]